MTSEDTMKFPTIPPDGDTRARRTGNAADDARQEDIAISLDVSVQDVIVDAITTLAGISEALGYRTAVSHDEMLEMLARTAELQADELRELIGNE